MYQKGRAWIELNLDNLKNNVQEFQNILPVTCQLMPAVKADAYGHGALPISKALQKFGIENFCVASAVEGIELRKAGIKGQILILGYTHPELFPELSKYGLTQTVVDYDYAKTLNRFGKKLNVHIGVDTGMHRLGERYNDLNRILDMWNMENLHISGVFSHLCVSDGSSKEEQSYTEGQIQDFQNLIQSLRHAGVPHFQTHLQGSYGVLNYPELQFDFARVGIALYGVLSSPTDLIRSQILLKPVLSLKARIECIHPLHTGEAIGYGLTYTARYEMKIAVVSIGYADGIPRNLSGNEFALVKGMRAPFIGRICMDQLFLDVTGIPDITSGEEVVFIGESGSSFITADVVASRADTISNELLSRLGKRLERVII